MYIYIYVCFHIYIYIYIYIYIRTLRCRAFLAEPTAEADSVPELLGVGGDATLRVSRMHPYWKQPYTGTIGLQTGEVAEDIVQYLALSEQTPASMGLSVEWDNETGSVLHAEGFLITLLPGFIVIRLSSNNNT